MTMVSAPAPCDAGFTAPGRLLRIEDTHETLRRHRVSWVSSILRRRPGAVNPASHGAGALTIVMPRFQIRPSRYGKAHIAGAAPSIQGSQRMWPLAVLADTGKSRI